MGSQVNFYMVPEDEASFCSFVLQDPDVQVVTGLYSGSRFERLAVPLPPSSEPYAWCTALWNRRVISREDIDNHRYCFIEFSRSLMQPDGLTPGRIWAEMDLCNMDAERQEAFRAWFRRLAQWLNKWPYRSSMYRIGPKTKEFLDKGGRAVVYGIGDSISITETRGSKVVRSKPTITSEQPTIDDDHGDEDLTIEL